MMLFKVDEFLDNEKIEEIKNVIKNIIGEDVKIYTSNLDSFIDDEIDYRLKNIEYENLEKKEIEKYSEYIKNLIDYDDILAYDNMDSKIQKLINDYNNE